MAPPPAPPRPRSNREDEFEPSENPRALTAAGDRPERAPPLPPTRSGTEDAEYGSRGVPEAGE